MRRSGHLTSILSIRSDAAGESDPEHRDQADAIGECAQPAGALACSDFRVLYDQHFRRVWWALRRLGVREADLMDLVQTVFLTAYLKLPTFEGRSQLFTWLSTICWRVAAAHRRSGVVRHEVATDPISLAECVQPNDTCGAVCTEREVLAEHIVSKISEPQRLVFMLCEVDGLTGVEVAALLNIPLGTVRSRLRFARTTFRRETRRLALRHMPWAELVVANDK